MSAIAILGSGFGLYGYLPALVARCGQRVVLPERYRERFEQRTELTPFAPYVQWAPDESAALKAASGAVLALCPEMQTKWLATCLAQPQLEMLILEKPLATDPLTAAHWQTRLEQSGKVVRIAYLFRYLAWAAQLQRFVAQAPESGISISWQFLAHHFRHNLLTWKRTHQQGGGAIRFYGIHLIALLAELGYSNVLESVCSRNPAGDISRWNAVFTSEGLPQCEVEVDSATTENRFCIASGPTAKRALHIEQADPFATSPALQGPGSIDRRVEVLGRLCQSAWNDSRLMLNFYRPAVDLWHLLEERNCIAADFAAA